MGTKYLQSQLNIQLTKHIKESLPNLRSKLLSQLSLLEKDVIAFKNTFSGDSSQNSTKIVMTNIQNLVSKIDLQLGFSSGDINITEYSGGANINNILNQKFAYELHKKLYLDISLAQKIVIAIKNSTGVNSQLFSPHHAFSSLIKKQIEEFKDVLISTISLVSNELYNIFASQLKCLSMYPKLRDEIENLCTRSLKKFEDEAKNNSNTFIQIQLSYINTNHPDFISAIEGRNINNKGAVVSASDVKKGWIGMHTSGLLKNQRDVFLVIKKDQIHIFKDDTEQECKLTIENSNLKVRDIKQKYSFSIFSFDGKNLSKDLKSLDLSGNNAEDVENWKAALLSVGIMPEFQIEDKTLSEKIDPQTQKQVDQVILYFNAYKNLIVKILCDSIPKICMYFLINNFRTYCSEDLVPEVLSLDVKKLIRESEESVKKREETIKLYESCQKGLELINEVMRQNDDDDMICKEIEDSYIENKRKENDWDNSDFSKNSFKETTPSYPSRPNPKGSNNSSQPSVPTLSAPKKPPPIPKRD